MPNAIDGHRGFTGSPGIFKCHQYSLSDGITGLFGRTAERSANAEFQGQVGVLGSIGSIPGTKDTWRVHGKSASRAKHTGSVDNLSPA
ncbi:hypothetical protein GCM10027342_05420 [Photobacterium alginatilyticum]